MKTETIEKIKSLVKEVLLEIKDNKYDEMFHELLFHCRYTRVSAAHPPSTTTFTIGEVKYSLYPYERIDCYGIKITTVIDNVDYELGKIVYNGDDYRLDNVLERSTTNYTDLLADSSTQIGILINFI